MSRLLVALFGLLLSWQALAAELTVSAAASLTNAFRELTPLFDAQNPGVKLNLNFGASGALLQQIAKGAPA
ncbi:MAG: substrate-binding domain-containing protein, partial [Chromatiales bacterium]